MEWLSAQSEWAGPLGVVVGAILSLWALAVRLDKALRSHLTASFATREDFDRLETKVDTLLGRLWEDAVESRKRK